jgi:hypothetical protein
MSLAAVGLVVGCFAWAAGEAALGAFAARRVPVTNRLGVSALAVTDRTAADAEIKNVALSSGVFGALLGAALGASGGLGRRSPVAARRASVFGLVVGALAGSGMALVVLPQYYRSFLRFRPEGLIVPILLHAAIWGAVGAAGGLALGLGLGGRGRAVRALLGGMGGAIMGAVFYEIVGAIAFPMSRTYQPAAADWPPRLLGRLLVASLAALGAALAIADVETASLQNRPEIPPPGG